MQFKLFPSRRCHRPRSKKGMGTEMRSSFLVGERSFVYLSWKPAQWPLWWSLPFRPCSPNVPARQVNSGM
jgi:hypothetical protein